ncbi:protein tyrosine phosphatase [Arthrobacter sp. ISL-72]|uniref:protein tyrosine phosphatase n=1 Tax=Arthrobacter sp. ISL-72 TaxID=2819114 RepID=UPI001BE6C2EC|nr:protein tyrosine phosphatase [Arthrobacter sp. ISL-72]MBT2593913.1 protein tyrosine phosphatase [Arthrobacter sp. ISL-72]
MSFFTVLATSKVAAGALAAGTLAIGGTGAAAYAGALPADVQQSAHELLGAPAPKVGGVSETAKAGATAEASASATPSASAEAAADADGQKADAKASATPVGPDAAGPAAYGLCTAFINGGLEASSTAFKSLAVAAEGEANIESYCADVTAAGKSAGKSEDHKVEGAVSADVEAPKVPETPELPTQAAVPAAPELPAEVPTELPTSVGRQ